MQPSLSTGMSQVTINALPHPAQATVHNCPARFRVLDAGRRFGKTRLGVMECIEAATKGKVAWWVAPSYKMSDVGWRPLKRMAGQIPGAKVNQVDRRVEFKGGGSVTVRSADNPQSLRGEGIDFLVMDECAFISEEAWTEALRPALADKKGHALFISTPKGRNWFWKLYQRGQDGGEWARFQYPTRSNPFIDPAEIEEAKKLLPERVYLQEFEAIFLEDGGGVFRRVQNAISAIPVSEWQEDRQYVAGVDVASMEDFTVACVFDVEARSMVHLDRFNRCDYNVLEDRLHGLYQRFKMTAIQVEANSIGLPVIDHLRTRGMNVLPFTTTNATKDAIIQSLQSAFEHDEIKLINHPILFDELLAYTAERSKSGNMIYGAPEGTHDVCVMALAIGWNAIGQQVTFFDNW